MCFAPQRHALFRHRNFQNWSEHGVFCTFWLRNVLHATTACTFSTSQLPKVVRTWCVLYILTSKCASHHNGVQFFISHLASWLRTHRFSEPTFRPSGGTIEKHRVSWLSYLFAHLHLLSSDSFSSLIFSLLLFSSLFFCSTSAFHLSILSEVWLLNFLRLCAHGYIAISHIVHSHYCSFRSNSKQLQPLSQSKNRCWWFIAATPGTKPQPRQNLCWSHSVPVNRLLMRRPASTS